MSTAVIASVRAIAQAHTTFSRAAFGAVLLADSRIESQRGNSPNNKTKQSNHQNDLGHRCLPFDSTLLGCPLCIFLPQKGPLAKSKGDQRGTPRTATSRGSLWRYIFDEAAN